MRRLAPLILACPLVLTLALADGPADNSKVKVRPIPPPGVEVPAADQRSIAQDLLAFQTQLAAAKLDPAVERYWPDVLIFEKAVRVALSESQFYTRQEVAAASKLLAEGRERLAQLQKGQTPWTRATGLVVRGYRSQIDDSVQPYGLVIPEGHDFNKPSRLDVWWHGRGEKLSELAFILDREKNRGEFPQDSAVVLHPYGRYCNANKFAGETDTFEAIDHLERDLAIDPERRVARGFSMGGAACWQFATHHPGYWVAAAPGAGFAETKKFLNDFQNEPVQPTWYQERLWKLTNATDYALNLFNVPTVAYSGEVDKQRQAAELMVAAAKAEGIAIPHVIGKMAGHKYTPEAKAEINTRIDALVAERKPRDEIRFVTYTLAYPRCDWVRLDGLSRHWAEARVHAKIADKRLTVTTQNVTRLTLAPGASRADRLTIDGQTLPFAGEISLVKSGDRWVDRSQVRLPGLVKRPGLQGPIDDAFTKRFIMVRPTGEPLSAESGAWVGREFARAVAAWRTQFRGEPLVVNDIAVTAEIKASANLILWGDARSNSQIAALQAKLPVRWDADSFTLGETSYPTNKFVPALVYPNPDSPGRYVVLNSGFTFREYDALNNARQVAKLPDYAVIDVTTPPNPVTPGEVARAGFFGESWELLPGDGK